MTAGILNTEREGLGAKCRLWGFWLGSLSVTLQRLTKGDATSPMAWQILIQWVLT